MDAVDEIISQIPMGQLATQLGIDEDTAEAAVRSAVPALLGGLGANAQDPGGAVSLEKALAQHANDPFQGLDLAAVDIDDGDKIVHHIYGDSTDEVVNRLGSGTQGAAGGGLMKMLLPLLAPLIMGWLAKKMGGAGHAAQAPQSQPGGDLGGMLDSLTGGSSGGGGGGGDLGDLLDSVTGAGQSGSGAGGGIGDILGGLLGGGGGSGGGTGGGLGDIGDLLGGLLGGGTRA